MGAWKIGRRAVGCQECDAAFEAGSEHYTLLEISTENLVRIDLCSTCFEGRELTAERLFWKTRRPLPRSRAPQVDLQGLKTLLVQLSRLELDRRQRQLGYLIALILLRKRQFKLVGTARTDADGDRLVLADPGGELRIEVPVEPPTRAEMPILREALRNLFEETEEEAESALPEKLFAPLVEGPSEEPECGGDQPLESGPDAG